MTRKEQNTSKSKVNALPFGWKAQAFCNCWPDEGGQDGNGETGIRRDGLWIGSVNKEGKGA